MRTTITVDDNLLVAAKRHAARRGTTLSAFIEEALRAKLAAPLRRTTRAFNLVTFRGDGPHSGVDLDRTGAILEGDDIERYGATRAAR